MIHFKKFIAFALSFFITYSVLSQSYNTTVSFGDVPYQYGESSSLTIEPTPGSGVYVVGSIRECKTCLSNDIGLTFIDGLGNVKWSKRFGFPKINETPSQVIIDDNGANLIIVGKHHDVFQNIEGGIIMSIDLSGNLSWSRRIDPDNPSHKISFTTVGTVNPLDGKYVASGTLTQLSGAVEPITALFDGTGDVPVVRHYDVIGGVIPEFRPTHIEQKTPGSLNAVMMGQVTVAGKTYTFVSDLNSATGSLSYLDIYRASDGINEGDCIPTGFVRYANGNFGFTFNTKDVYPFHPAQTFVGYAQFDPNLNLLRQPQIYYSRVQHTYQRFHSSIGMASQGSKVYLGVRFGNQLYNQALSSLLIDQNGTLYNQMAYSDFELHSKAGLVSSSSQGYLISSSKESDELTVIKANSSMLASTCDWTPNFYGRRIYLTINDLPGLNPNYKTLQYPDPFPSKYVDYSQTSCNTSPSSPLNPISVLGTEMNKLEAYPNPISDEPFLTISLSDIDGATNIEVRNTLGQVVHKRQLNPTESHQIKVERSVFSKGSNLISILDKEKKTLASKTVFKL